MSWPSLIMIPSSIIATLPWFHSLTLLSSLASLESIQSQGLKTMAESATIVTVDAILFDMDGTLIDSTPGVLKAWHTFSNDYNLGDSTSIAHATHGRRLYDTLKEYCGLVEEDRLLKEIDRFEDEVIQGGPMALPGAFDMVSKLASHPSSKSKWTIVTSGKTSNKYAPRALERAGIPLPSAGIITANDVSQGKPHPAPYLAGALQCFAEPKYCLVVEDSISGLEAGHAAGCRTLAVCTSTPQSTILESATNPDFIVSDLTKVTVEMVGGRIQLTIDQS